MDGFSVSVGKGVLNLLEVLGAFVIFTVQTFRFIFALGLFDGQALFLPNERNWCKIYSCWRRFFFFVGMVMALQLGGPMEKQIQGISSYMGGGISLAMVRELAPVLDGSFISWQGW